MVLKRLPLADFRRAEKETAPGSIVVAKDGGEVIGPEDDRVLQFVISTNAVDREGDTIDQSGWDLAEFTKSGVVLFAHNSQEPPVAKHVATWLEGGKLRSRAKFLTEDEHPFSALMYTLYTQGVMKATSVGFLPVKWEVNEERKGPQGWPGIDFKAQRLLEYSLVPVPANPEALIEMGKSLDLRLLHDAASKVLDETTIDPLAPRAQLQSLYKLTQPLFTKSVGAPSGAGPVVQGADLDPVDSDPEDLDAEDQIVKRLAGAAEELAAKHGRVLSASNESKLREARSLLDGVLGQLEADDTESAASEAPVARAVDFSDLEAEIDEDEELEIDEGALREAIHRSLSLDASDELEIEDDIIEIDDAQLETITAIVRAQVARLFEDEHHG